MYAHVCMNASERETDVDLYKYTHTCMYRQMMVETETETDMEQENIGIGAHSKGGVVNERRGVGEKEDGCKLYGGGLESRGGGRGGGLGQRAGEGGFERVWHCECACVCGHV